MRSIIDTLKNGTGKERLSVVSDIVTILGVSMATILGGAFALNEKIDVENVLGFVILGLLSLAGALVVVAFFLGGASWLQARLPVNSLIRNLLLSALWLVFFTLCIYAAYFAYAVLTSVQFVRP